MRLVQAKVENFGKPGWPGRETGHSAGRETGHSVDREAGYSAVLV